MNTQRYARYGDKRNDDKVSPHLSVSLSLSLSDEYIGDISQSMLFWTGYYDIDSRWTTENIKDSG